MLCGKNLTNLKSFLVFKLVFFQFLWFWSIWLRWRIVGYIITLWTLFLWFLVLEFNLHYRASICKWLKQLKLSWSKFISIDYWQCWRIWKLKFTVFNFYAIFSFMNCRFYQAEMRFILSLSNKFCYLWHKISIWEWWKFVNSWGPFSISRFYECHFRILCHLCLWGSWYHH